MAYHEQTPYPGYIQLPQNSEFPQQPLGYQQQPTGYLQQQGCPQQQGYPQVPGFVQQQYPQQSPAYFQGPTNYVNEPYGSPPVPSPPFHTSAASYGPPPQVLHSPVAASYEEDKVKEPQDTSLHWAGSSDKEPWRAFIIKAYAVLMVQLAFLVGVIAVFQFEPNIKSFVEARQYWVPIFGIGFVFLYLTLVVCGCCGNFKRQWPTNMIALAILTISLGSMLGSISSVLDMFGAMFSVGISACSCLAIAILSFHPKFDFTRFSGALIILVWVIFVSGMIVVFTYDKIPIWQTISGSVISFIFMMYLYWDTSLVIGGKRLKIHSKEYIFGAMNFYFDIVFIVFYHLQKKE